MRAVTLASIFALLAAVPAQAADIVVSLKTAVGEGVRDAVVTFKPAAGVAPPSPEGRYEVVQEDIQFRPFVQIVPGGADVRFPNHDRVRHHVYSFSPVKRFELKLYGRDETRSVRFDKAGVVALGCNIHDQMSAYIVVVDTPFAAKSDPTGEVVLKGVPQGPGTLTVWQPYQRAPGGARQFALTVAPQGERQAYVLELRPPMAMHGH